MNIYIKLIYIYTGAEEGVEVVECTELDLAKIPMTFASFDLFVFYMHFDINVVLYLYTSSSVMNIDN